jgi:hypothetical protein
MKDHEKKSLLRTLRLTRTQMHHAAMKLHYYSGGDSELEAHSKEMQGAVDIIETWIEGIKNYDESRESRQVAGKSDQETF